MSSPLVPLEQTPVDGELAQGKAMDTVSYCTLRCVSAENLPMAILCFSAIHKFLLKKDTPEDREEKRKKGCSSFK